MTTPVRTDAPAGIDPRGPRFGAALTLVLLVAVLLLGTSPAAHAVLAVIVASFALGAFGGSSSTPAPVVKSHPATAAAVKGGPLTPADVQVRAYVARYAAAETAWFAAHKTYADPLTVAGEPAQQEPSAAAVGVASYCVMDSAGSAGAHWFVASSRLGGLLPTAYATRAAASDACR